MAEITFGDKTFKYRSLMRKEIREQGLSDLGYGNHYFQTPQNDDKTSIDEGKLEKGQEIVVNLCVDGGIDAVDAAGGNEAILKIWQAIIAKTYCLPGEEKNS